MADGLEQLTQQLGAAVQGLTRVLTNSHGVYKGSGLASLAEAQGGQIVRTGGQAATYNHLGQVQSALRSITEGERDINSLLGKIGSVDRGQMIGARARLQPLLDYARQCRTVLGDTVQAAEELEANAQWRVRMQGIGFGAGGLGPGSARDVGSLVTTQLQQLVARGQTLVQGNGLLPGNFPRAAQLLEEIQELPVNAEAAATKVNWVMALVYARLAAAAVQASATAAGQFFTELLAAIRTGTLLIPLPIIMPDPRKIMYPEAEA